MEKNIKENRLDRLKGKQPFRVPDGYMEGLTNRIMEGLPESPIVEAESISFVERIRPWLYLAAVFAGMGLFFKAINFSASSKSSTNSICTLLKVRSGNNLQLSRSTWCQQ